MDGNSGRSASLKRRAEDYGDLLAGVRGFTLFRWIEPDGGEGPIREEAVYRSDAPAEVHELRRLLAARATDGHCMCLGSASISLDSRAASAQLTVHHGESVRWQDGGWGDFMLERGRELAEWMAARGVQDVRDEMDESQRQRAQDEAEEASWVAAMPAAVLPYRQAMLGLGSTGFDLVPSPELLAQLSRALSHAESDDARRIRVLLGWHAAGSGRCSGLPLYELIPETLLLAEAPAALRAVASAHDLTVAELAGAARLVASWHARDRSEFDSLPADAWDRLTAAAAAGDDEDKRDRLARRREQSKCRR
jgi:hypothetical protein